MVLLQRKESKEEKQSENQQQQQKKKLELYPFEKVQLRWSSIRPVVSDFARG